MGLMEAAVYKTLLCAQVDRKFFIKEIDIPFLPAPNGHQLSCVANFGKHPFNFLIHGTRFDLLNRTVYLECGVNHDCFMPLEDVVAELTNLGFSPFV